MDQFHGRARATKKSAFPGCVSESSDSGDPVRDTARRWTASAPPSRARPEGQHRVRPGRRDAWSTDSYGLNSHGEYSEFSPSSFQVSSCRSTAPARPESRPRSNPLGSRRPGRLRRCPRDRPGPRDPIGAGSAGRPAGSPASVPGQPARAGQPRAGPEGAARGPAAHRKAANPTLRDDRTGSVDPTRARRGREGAVKARADGFSVADRDQSPYKNISGQSRPNGTPPTKIPPPRRRLQLGLGATTAAAAGRVHDRKEKRCYTTVGKTARPRPLVSRSLVPST